MSFVPTIEIDLQALRCNLDLVRRHAPNSRVMAVIKADGYGHGMLEVARALEEADALAVARVDEGVQLRHAQRSRRLVVLGGAHDQAEFEAAADAGLEVVVHHPHQIDLLARSGVRRPLRCWIKLDSGMHRLGFPPFECRLRLEQMRDMESVAEVVGILTHLANADDLGDDYTKKQFERFHEAVQGMGLPVSLANSAAVLGWPDTHADWVRPGIMLYGASPFVA
ncbi:MAG TPA: alanine racemase, partial [Chromatiaceae bacterium]|nr:alanine racemase [Chromatiaceae bacterium]